MKAMVISYSLTGNNEALAASLAVSLAAEHARVTEARPRTMGAILLDMLFNRTPLIEMPEGSMECHDLVVFVGPVWMGRIASPLRACFGRLGPKIGRYAFVSISGGADGPNPGLADELRKRLKKEPVSVVDMHVADLLPEDPKPIRAVTSAYRLKAEEAEGLADTALSALRKAGAL